MRWFVGILFAAAAVGLTATPAPAKVVMAARPVSQRAVTAEVVAVGKVTAVEKDEVEAAPFPGAEEKAKFKVAVIQVSEALAGAKGVTHLKVGFVPQPANPPRGTGGIPRPRGLLPPDLKAGDEFLFFLVKHPEAGFHVMPATSPPVDGKPEIEAARKVLAVVADPMAALKAGKAEDRHAAALALIGKYRSYPEFPAGEVEEKPIPAEESKLILKALAEGEWGGFRRDQANALGAFFSLGVSEADGFTPPKLQPGAPGQPPDVAGQTKKAFQAWLDGRGKDYVIKQVVAKKK
ncbi:MAG: hypothetical protein K2X82_14480 [Gemmataceae bacterium]|nr:hypothetical protein [Gemmataceae bacterium]